MFEVVSIDVVIIGFFLIAAVVFIVYANKR
jgi:hypothetical protein